MNTNEQTSKLQCNSCAIEFLRHRRRRVFYGETAPALPAKPPPCSVGQLYNTHCPTHCPLSDSLLRHSTHPKCRLPSVPHAPTPSQKTSLLWRLDSCPQAPWCPTVDMSTVGGQVNIFTISFLDRPVFCQECHGMDA